jgi:hypothetical protein
MRRSLGRNRQASLKSLSRTQLSSIRLAWQISYLQRKTHIPQSAFLDSMMHNLPMIFSREKQISGRDCHPNREFGAIVWLGVCCHQTLGAEFWYFSTGGVAITKFCIKSPCHKENKLVFRV